MVRFIRPIRRHTQVLGLLVAQPRELHADLLQVQRGDFLVQLLRQSVDADFVDVVVLLQVQLRQLSGLAGGALGGLFAELPRHLD